MTRQISDQSQQLEQPLSGKSWEALR